MTDHTTAADVVAAVTARAAEVGVRVRLQAVDVDGDASIGIDPNEPVVTASVFKVPIAVELARQAVGKPAVAALLDRLGLPGTAVPQDCGELLRTTARTSASRTTS